MQINVTFDASAADAPAGFETAVEAAVSYLDSVIATPITVNIQFSYGEVAGQPLVADAVGENEPFGIFTTYTQIKSALAAVATSADDLASVASLPTTDPTGGGDFFLNTAEAKALGLYPADATGIDGYVGLSSSVSFTFDPNNRAVSGEYDAIGILEHEITEVLGRDAIVGEAQSDETNLYSPLDLFRYASAGVRDLTPAGDYFSVNGTTLLSQFNDAAVNGGDPGDWASSVPGDSFDAFAQPGVELAVSATDLRELDVLGFHSTAPAPVAPISTPTPEVASEAPITFSQNYSLGSGQALYFTAGPRPTDLAGLTFSGEPTLTSAGTITLISSAGSNSVSVGVAGSQHGGLFSNTSMGSLYVEATGAGASAYGFGGGAASPSVENAGLIQVVSSDGSAIGSETSDANAPFTNASDGVVKVWAADDAVGADFLNGGAFSNAGLINVTAQNAVGEQGASSFTNSGTIEATDISGGWGSVGVDVGPQISSLTNTGKIQADYVLYYDTSASGGVSSNISIGNSGQMIGSIVLGNGNDQVTNTGFISGDIYFGDGNSQYNGTGGTISGAIYLGFGVNTVTLGNEGESVYGGFGSDSITGGSGNDFIEIGGGDNTINGGGGFNVLSFADSPSPVTVNLATGTATDDGTDTINNIQEVIGSQLTPGGDVETLTAGQAAAVLIAGTGLDTLTGGPGNDTLIAGPDGGTMTGGGGDNTFIYTAGDGVETITDFNSNDVLKIYGDGATPSYSQQDYGVDVMLFGQLALILKTATLSELNGSDVISSSAQYPGLSLPPSLPIYGTNTINIEQDLTIAPGETINEQGATVGFLNEGQSLDVGGVVTVSYPVQALSDVVYGWMDSSTNALGHPISPTADTITLGDDANFSVTETEGSATGFAPLFTTSLVNGGTISITAAGQAYGVDAPSSIFNFTNGGAVPGAYTNIAAKGAAWGLALGDGGDIINTGQLSVTGGTTAYGVQIDAAQGYSLTNSGSLGASSDSGQSFAVAIAGLASTSGAFTIDNSGTIAAQTAITEYFGVDDGSQLPSVDIVNSGTISGTVVLDSSSASLVNTGVITGDIRLSDDSSVGTANPGDTIDLSGGTSAGDIFIAPGSAGDIALHDVIETGPSGGVITIAGGESNLSVDITAVAGVSTTVTFDVASSQAAESQNADGSWTIDSGTDGVETVSHVLSLAFTDKTVTLAAPSAVGNDFNDDNRGDFLIENASGAVVVGEVGASDQAAYAQVSGLGSEWKFAGDGDFLGDNRSAYLIENSNGAVDVGEVVAGQAHYTQVAGLGPEWTFVGEGDFLGDGKTDFLIENTSGAVVVGEVGAGDQATYTQVAALGPEWSFDGVGDFLPGGKTGFLIENTNGAVVVGQLGSGDQAVYTQVAALGPEWTFEGVGDFLGRDNDQFLIENTNGVVDIGQVGANDQVSYTQVAVLGAEWKFVGVGDYLDEGHDQFLIENSAGAVDIGDYSPDFIADVFIHYTQVAGLGSEWAFH